MANLKYMKYEICDLKIPSASEDTGHTSIDRVLSWFLEA